MRKRLTGVAVLVGAISTTVAHAMSPNDARVMAEKYKALAKSYEELAQHYEALTYTQVKTDSAEAQSNSETQTGAKEQSQDVGQKASSGTPQPVSSWDGSMQSQFAHVSEAVEKVRNAGSDAPNSASVMVSSSLNSLNLPEGIINDDAISQKKPNIAVAEPWKGTSFGLGGSVVTGNSAATNYNANANLSYQPIVPWQNTLVMSYLYNRDDMPNGKGVKTNKFQGTITSSWNFDKHNGIYGRVNYLNDHLDSYSYILSESVGYKRQLFTSAVMSLSATVGPSLTQQKVKDTGEFSNALGAQGGIDYVWNFTDFSSFKQSILANWTADNATNYQTNSTLSMEIYKNLIVQLGFQINGNSWASAGKKRMNTITSTTIAYSF
ncbi:YdiY family protein [Caedibacter taeniospiralis]|jgi:putative salt-induced outer membrane protein YdiY|uniref:YdiY family protein n=1 Tax=Caedibacter taeniospiralis TaxID=28907 RepID=UPI0037C0A7EE